LSKKEEAMGRPRKAESELRRQITYRFSPETLKIINQISGTTKTAFIEAAIKHYHEFLTASEPEPEPEIKLAPAVPEPVPEPTRKLRAYRIGSENPVPLPAAVPDSAPVPAPTSSLRQPIYQIYIRHEPGTCPTLPEGFSYIDHDKSTGRRACPNEKQIHRVFAQPIGIEVARRRAEQLQAVASITRVWIEDRTGNLRNSWQKENGCWVRDN
jgi:hypothetical protein